MVSFVKARRHVIILLSGSLAPSRSTDSAAELRLVNGTVLLGFLGLLYQDRCRGIVVPSRAMTACLRHLRRGCDYFGSCFRVSQYVIAARTPPVFAASVSICWVLGLAGSTLSRSRAIASDQVFRHMTTSES